MTHSKGLDIVVLVSGRGTNLQAIIDAITAGSIQSRIKLVVANKSEAQALERAQKVHIKTKVVASKGLTAEAFQDALLQTVIDQNPDLIVLAGFMRLLSSRFINTFKNRIINIHPSLLPAFKGLHAIQQAIDAGVKVTGCTVHFVDEGCDTGPIILQATEEVLDDDTEESLALRLLKKEHQILGQAIKLLEQNKVVLQENKTLLRKEP